MKEKIIELFKPLCVMWSYIYTPALNIKIKYVTDKLYTFWYSRYFKECRGTIVRGSFIRGEKYIRISKGSLICKGARIEAIDSHLDERYTPDLLIGERCRIGHGTHITTINQVIIGDDTNIGDRCLISDNNHGNFAKNSYTFNNNSTIPDVFLLIEMQRPLHCKGPVIIESGCQIGEGTVILTGVRIGHHSIIASNSFVRENVPPYSIVAGNPSQIIRTFS